MKPPALLGAILAALFVGVGLAWFVWPRRSNGPVIRLKVVRQIMEQGRPVVFFRIDVADGRRVQISDVERISLNKTDSPYEELGLAYARPEPIPAIAFGAFSNTASLGLVKPSTEFWAPSQVSPLFDPGKGRQEFGVLAPTNAAVWRLRVKAELEDPRSWIRFKRSLVVWRLLRKRGTSAKDAASITWRGFSMVESAWAESELITNSVPGSP